MGKHTNYASVDRAGLVRRYAELRGYSHVRAAAVTQQWTRTELRECVESIENSEKGLSAYRGRHSRFASGPNSRFAKGATTNLSGFTTMVDGVTR